MGEGSATNGVWLEDEGVLAPRAITRFLIPEVELQGPFVLEGMIWLMRAMTTAWVKLP